MWKNACRWIYERLFRLIPILKTFAFCHSECQKMAIFTLFMYISQFFLFSNFVGFGMSKKAFWGLLHFWQHIDQKTCIAQRKHEILSLTFLITWPQMTLAWHNVTKRLGSYLEVSQARFMSFISFAYVWCDCFGRQGQRWQIKNLELESCPLLHIPDAESLLGQVGSRYNELMRSRHAFSIPRDVCSMWQVWRH